MVIAIFSLISEMQNENARVAENHKDAKCMRVKEMQDELDMKNMDMSTMTY